MNRLRLANALFLCLLMLSATMPWTMGPPVVRADDYSPWETELDSAQQPVRVAAFGTTYENDYIRISLQSAPAPLGVTVGLGPGGEPVFWTTAFLGPEMFAEAAANGVPSWGTTGQTPDIDPKAHIIVGTLDGPSGLAYVAGVYMSATDSGNVTYHHLLPIGEATPDLVNRLSEMTAIDMAAGAAAQQQQRQLGVRQLTAIEDDPCDSPTHCHDLYRQRIADALREFADCMKGQVPPMSLCAVACFILCAPFLAGTPAAYLACVAACLAGCTAISTIDWQTCEAALEAARDNAESSYCLCIEWKQDNCNQYDWEVDIVGCD